MSTSNSRHFKLASGGEGSWLSSKVGSGNRPRAFARALISLLLRRTIPDRSLIGFMAAGRDGHAGRGGFPQEINLRRGQGVGLVDEVAEGALQGQSLGGAGAGGRAEKLKLEM